MQESALSCAALAHDRHLLAGDDLEFQIPKNHDGVFTRPINLAQLLDPDHRSEVSVAPAPILSGSARSAIQPGTRLRRTADIIIGEWMYLTNWSGCATLAKSALSPRLSKFGGQSPVS